MHHLPACSRYSLHAPVPVSLKVRSADCATLPLRTEDCLKGCLIMHCLQKSCVRQLSCCNSVKNEACKVEQAQTLACLPKHQLAAAYNYVMFPRWCMLRQRQPHALHRCIFPRAHALHSLKMCTYVPGGSCSYDSTTVSLSVLCYVPNTALLADLQASYLQPAIRRQLSMLQHKMVQQGSLQPWTVFQVVLSRAQCAF